MWRKQRLERIYHKIQIWKGNVTSLWICLKTQMLILQLRFRTNILSTFNFQVLALRCQLKSNIQVQGLKLFQRSLPSKSWRALAKLGESSTCIIRPWWLPRHLSILTMALKSLKLNDLGRLTHLQTQSWQPKNVNGLSQVIAHQFMPQMISNME